MFIIEIDQHKAWGRNTVNKRRHRGIKDIKWYREYKKLYYGLTVN